MGSVIRFARPRPLIRHAAAKSSVSAETREARRSLFILTGSFLVIAIVMCATVVVTVSSTWTDVIIMSAFVIVFALLKIVLANALIYTMLSYDAATAEARPPTDGAPSYRRYMSIRRVSLVRVRRKGSVRAAKAST